LKAMTRNRMSLIGDKHIGTRHPIYIRAEFEPLEKEEVEDGTHQTLMVKSLRLYSEDRMLTDADDIRIASFLMFHGRWPEHEEEAETDEDGGVIAVNFPVRPDDEMSRQEKQGFDVIGTLSGMLSSVYASKTTKQDEIISIRAAFEPGETAQFIPAGYFEKER